MAGYAVSNRVHSSSAYSARNCGVCGTHMMTRRTATASRNSSPATQAETDADVTALMVFGVTDCTLLRSAADSDEEKGSLLDPNGSCTLLVGNALGASFTSAGVMEEEEGGGGESSGCSAPRFIMRYISRGRRRESR